MLHPPRRHLRCPHITWLSGTNADVHSANIASLSEGNDCVLLYVCYGNINHQYTATFHTTEEARGDGSTELLGRCGGRIKHCLINYFFFVLILLPEIITSSTAMAEGPRDTLISRNSVTTKHPI